jgi:hypothetical protein
MGQVTDVFNVAFAAPGHRYVMKLVVEETDKTSKFQKVKDALKTTDNDQRLEMAKNIALATLTTKVEIVYTNSFGGIWNFTKNYRVGGLEMDASIGIGGLTNPLKASKDSSEKGLFGDGGLSADTEATKDISGRWASWKAKAAGFWDIGKGMASDLKEKYKDGGIKGIAKGFGKDVVKPKGGLDFGLLQTSLEETLKLSKDGIVADKPGRYWSPQDIQGPVLSVGFIKGHIKVGPGSADYQGISALRFIGSAGSSIPLDFPGINLMQAEMGKLEPSLEAKLTVVEGGAGYAKKVD